MWTTNRFAKLQQTGTVTGYRKLGIDMVSFIVAASKGALPAGVEVFIPPEQREIAEDYYDAMLRGDLKEEVVLLQRLLFSIFTRAVVGEEDIRMFPFYVFLVFYAFRKDGALSVCNAITQIISMMVFFARACIFNAILAAMKAEKRGFFE